MKSLTKRYLTVLCITFSVSSCALESAKTLEAAKVAASGDWVVHNRTATFSKDDPAGTVYFAGQAKPGVAWLKNSNFSEGVIEADIKGNDVKDKSYVGIAFRGIDEKTYEAVYFRPFNFNAPDELHKSHAVQYESEPDNSWEKLRKQQPGAYERAISPAVNPNEFFHVKVVAEAGQVSVYVNNAAEPTLSVASLAKQKSGWVGVWMGNNADGTFKNLKITSK
ncbi:MAG: hypothetical protein NTV43_10715 [Methylococcales bacterium]|nr:hypothetical protein [Methylococcales bacterium]